MESIVNRARGVFYRLPKRLQVWAFFALTVAKSPQLYVDRAWGASRKYFFSVIFISLLLSKCFHIFVNPRTVGVFSLVFWGPTFFVVDILLILVACRLARSFESRICRDLAALIVILFRLVVPNTLVNKKLLMASQLASFGVHLCQHLVLRRQGHRGPLAQNEQIS